MLTKLQKLRAEREEGFTLIELLVVILIIGVLSAIAIPAFMNQRKSAIDASVKSDLTSVAKEIATQEIKQYGSVIENHTISKDGITLMPAFILPVGSITMSKGNVINVYGDPNNPGAYCLIGVNPNGGESGETGITYDSNGGMGASDSCQVGKAIPSSTTIQREVDKMLDRAGGTGGGGQVEEEVEQDFSQGEWKLTGLDPTSLYPAFEGTDIHLLSNGLHSMKIAIKLDSEGRYEISHEGSGSVQECDYYLENCVNSNGTATFTWKNTEGPTPGRSYGQGTFHIVDGKVARTTGTLPDGLMGDIKAWHPSGGNYWAAMNETVIYTPK